VSVYKGYTDENGNVNDPFRERKLIESIKLRFDLDDLNQKGGLPKRQEKTL
jgi:hypothetical protein